MSAVLNSKGVESSGVSEEQGAVEIHVKPLLLLSSVPGLPLLPLEDDPGATKCTVKGSATLSELKACVRAKLRLDSKSSSSPPPPSSTEETLFLFSQDGHPLDGSGKVADAFAGHLQPQPAGGAARTHSSCFTATKVFALVGGHFVSRPTSFGLTDNFAARSFPIPKGFAAPTPAALSAAAAALYVFMDSDAHKRDKIMAAAAALASSNHTMPCPACFLNGMKLLCAKRALREHHKAAIMAGVLASTARLLPYLAREPSLLAHLPRAFSWMLASEEARPWLDSNSLEWR